MTLRLPGMPATTTATRATSPETDPDLTDELGDVPGFAALRTMPGPNHPDPAPEPAPTADNSGRRAPASESNGTATSTQGFFRQRAKSYATVAKALLQGAGGWLNMVTGAVDDAFLPDDDDNETIPPPLGRLAARRIKLGADPSQLSDIEDIGMAAVGIIVWLAKGFTAVAEARRERRRVEAGKAVHTDPGDGQ